MCVARPAIDPDAAGRQTGKSLDAISALCSVISAWPKWGVALIINPNFQRFKRPFFSKRPVVDRKGVNALTI